MDAHPGPKNAPKRKNRVLNIESELQKRVVGQEKALKAIAKAIKRNKAGLSDSNKPIGSFLFWGQQAWVKPRALKLWRNSCLIAIKILYELT